MVTTQNNVSSWLYTLRLRRHFDSNPDPLARAARQEYLVLAYRREAAARIALFAALITFAVADLVAGYREPVTLAAAGAALSCLLFWVGSAIQRRANTAGLVSASIVGGTEMFKATVRLEVVLLATRELKANLGPYQAVGVADPTKPEDALDADALADMAFSLLRSAGPKVDAAYVNGVTDDILASVRATTGVDLEASPQN